jgi:hypothetical protein
MARRSTAAAQRGPGLRFVAIGVDERTRVTALAQEQPRVEREPTRPLLVQREHLRRLRVGARSRAEAELRSLLESIYPTFV